MAIFDDLLLETRAGGKLEKFLKVDASVIERTIERYPSLPLDYISFLKEIGGGEIRSPNYVLYNGLLESNEIYDDVTAESLEDILIFGDDMQGYCYGFDIEKSWAIVEINPTDMSYRKTFDKFSDFIKEKLDSSSL